MSGIETITTELRAEAEVDFFHVCMVAEILREELDLRTQKEILSCTLDVIRRLMVLGVYPGDYGNATTILFWPGEPDEVLKRIENEWMEMGMTPTLEHPICWFGLKRADT